MFINLYVLTKYNCSAYIYCCNKNEVKVFKKMWNSFEEIPPVPQSNQIIHHYDDFQIR